MVQVFSFVGFNSEAEALLADVSALNRSNDQITNELSFRRVDFHVKAFIVLFQPQCLIGLSAQYIIRVVIKQGTGIGYLDSGFKSAKTYEELIALETLPTLDGRYKFPQKDAIKVILGRSPNCFDALALSFAHPVIAGNVADIQFASEFS